MTATETLLQGATEIIRHVNASYTAGGGTLVIDSAVTDHGGSAVAVPYEILVGRNRPTAERRFFLVTAGAGTSLTVAASPGYTDDQNYVAGDQVDLISAWETQRRLRAFATLHTHTGGVDGSLLTPAVVYNALVNGDFHVWQRGTSFAAAVSAAYTADRWRWVGSGAGVVTIARDTSVPAVGATAINTPYSLKLTATTADTAIAGGDVYFLDQLLEGYDYRALTNGFALSFWVKAALTGTYCVAFRNKGADRSYVAEYTVSAANTWEYKTVVVAAPPTAGTWDYTTGIGLQVMFVLADATKGATAGSWQAAVNYATNNQVNGMNTGQVFQLALVNLIPGSVPAPLVPLPYAVQFTRAQRYAQRLGAASGIGGTTNMGLGSGFCDSTTHAYVTTALRVAMGGVPTATFSAASTFSVFSGAAVITALTAIALNNSSPELVTLACTVAAGLTAGQGCLLIDSAGASSILLEWNPT